MASQITFTWRSGQGFGIILSVIGWTLLFQIIPIIHTIEVIKFGITFEEQVIIILGLVLTTVTLTAFIGSVLENFLSEEELYREGLIKITSILLIMMIFYEIGFLVALPLLDALSPFIAIEFIAGLQGSIAYITSIFISLLFPGLIWWIADILKNSSLLSTR